MSRKFLYSPGLPGYGTKGIDGSTGLAGLAMYFSTYDGLSDSTTINSRIASNKELFPSGGDLPGFPARTYQTGDIFIDPNSKIFKIDLDLGGGNYYSDTGYSLSSSSFFAAGDVQGDAPNFSRYSNQYSSDKNLVDMVYSNTVSNYTQYPTIIYDNEPLYYGRVNYVGFDLAPDFSTYYPFEVWTIGSSDDADSIALARAKDTSTNTWRFGNLEQYADASLYLDFADVYIPGTIHATIDGTITTNSLYLPQWLRVGGDASFNSDVYIDGEIKTDVSILGDLTVKGGLVNLTTSTSIRADGNVVVETLSSTTNPGDAYLTGGNSTSTTATYEGGNIYVAGGIGSGYLSGQAGDGGGITIISGSGGDSRVSGGDGGNLVLSGGIAGEGNYTSGSTISSGNGGGVLITAPAGADATNTGAGNASPGNGGDVTISAGDGGDSTSNPSGGGDGGDVIINAGGAGSGTSAGGSAGTVYINSPSRFNSTASFASIADIAMTTSNNIIFANNNSAAPSYSFFGDGDTGFGRPAANQIGIFLGSTSAPRMKLSYGTIDAAFSTNSVLMRTNDDINIWPEDFAGNGEKVVIHGGNSSATGAATGDGGDLYLAAGDRLAGSGGAAGNTYIQGGEGYYDGNGGNVYIDAGIAGGTLNTRGSITLDVAATTSGTAGWIKLLGVRSTTSNFEYLQIVPGSGSVYSDTGTPSDMRLKNVKENAENILDNFSELNPFYFEWNDKCRELIDEVDDDTHIGLSAQEVEKVYPEVVDEVEGNNDEKYKIVRYEKMIPLLLGAINELKDIVADQQTQINELMNGN